MVKRTGPPTGRARTGDAASTPPAGLGPALRRAWLGYQQRLDSALEEAGFGKRRFPDGRVLRLCAGQAGSTISAIGRELGMTRQGAGKVVTRLREAGYVRVSESETSRREKSVTLTPRGMEYLESLRAAARAIEGQLRSVLGEPAFVALQGLLEELDPGESMRMRTYLQRATDQ
jgi:DNA-binding MarR family transcriptional regulator